MCFDNSNGSGNMVPTIMPSLYKRYVHFKDKISTTQKVCDEKPFIKIKIFSRKNHLLL